jgi:hypothetical protein
MLRPGEKSSDEDSPFLRYVQLEISTNIGWMHNHALVNEFQDDYQLFIDATRIDGGVPELSELDQRIGEYMTMMWDTNAKVSVFIKTDGGQLAYRAPGMPVTA